MRNNRKIDKYVARIGEIHGGSVGDLSVSEATRLLAVLRCLEAALTAYLIKMKI